MEKKKEKITGNRIALIILMSIYTLIILIFPKYLYGYGGSTLANILMYLPIIYAIAILVSVIFNKRNILKFVMLYPIINCLITIIRNIEYINFTTIISQLFQIAPYLFLAFIAFNKRKKTSQKIWFLPGVIYIVRFILSFFFNIFSGYAMVGIFGDFINILWIPIMFLLGYYLSDKKKEIKPINNTNGAYSVFEENYGYMDMATHVLLLLLTCGIWYLIWIYKATTFAHKSNRDSGTQLVLCMFVPFYNIYWTYMTSKMLDDEGRTKGIYSEISIICVILQLFVPIVVPILMQSKINTLIATKPVFVSKEEPKKQEDTNKQEEPKKETKSKAAEIKEYKELLDMGAITKEEYEKKKKQLLK